LRGGGGSVVWVGRPRWRPGGRRVRLSAGLVLAEGREMGPGRAVVGVGIVGV